MKNIFVLTKKPSDYPDAYVVREHVYFKGEYIPVREPLMIERDKRVIIDRMEKKGLTFFPAVEGDDPVIVGTWV